MKKNNYFKMKRTNINLHLYPSNMKHESRILKETKAIAISDLLDKIFIVGLYEDGTKKTEQIDKNIELYRIKVKSNFLPNYFRIIKHIEWSLKVFFRFKRYNVRIVHCHSLLTLPLGMLFKLFVKSVVIYDAHELETERNGWSWSRRIISKTIERKLIYHVNGVIVVSDSIANWYRKNYKLEKIYVIKNIPIFYKNSNSNILKKKFHIKNEDILFIYQGMLNKGRTIERLLNIFSRLDKNKHIVFMGYGNLDEEIKIYGKKFSNIHFQVAVKPHLIVNFTSSADVGIFLTESNCLSYRYSLPNKFFEYILSGLPIILSDNFIEMGEIIDKYKCGWIIQNKEEIILYFLNNLLKSDVEEIKKNVLKCKDKFKWKIEENKLLELYRNIL